MTTAYTRNMNQTATYWSPGLDDGYGGKDFTVIPPVLITCRWQDVAILFRDAAGREVTSSSIVYVDRTLAIGGFLFLGDAGMAVGGDPRRLAGAFEIRQIGTSPSLLATEVLNKVWL
jgi:hypothetical protein